MLERKRDTGTTTLLAALRHDRIEAPWLLEGPIDGESFQTYVEQVPLPALRPGDIVIIDNLAVTRAKPCQLIRSAGAKLVFLPKYSPDLNPIESICYAKPPRAQSKPSAPQSAKSSTHLRPKNAPTTSETQGVHQPKIIVL